MDRELIDRLIIKLLEDSISEEESLILKEWLQEAENVRYFNHFIEIDHLVKSKIEFDHSASLQKVRELIKERPATSRYSFLKYAATVAIILATGYFLFVKNKATITGSSIIENNIRAGTDKAILTLEDGSAVALEKGQSYLAENISSNGEKLIYTSGSARKAEVVYNFLTIPRGGQFFVQLADSTRVWLNAGSKLKYPVAFTEGTTREVELLYGEAYFEVSPAADHGGSHFAVSSGAQKTEVLGTEFNLKAYPDEPQILTTLVEGKVAINVDNNRSYLTSNQQSKVDVTTHRLTVGTVDVFDEISWKNGLISFNEKPLDKVMVDLSRWYDFEYEYATGQKKGIVLTAVLERARSIEEILDLIEEASNGDVFFEVNNKTITIK